MHTLKAPQKQGYLTTTSSEKTPYSHDTAQSITVLRASSREGERYRPQRRENGSVRERGYPTTASRQKTQPRPNFVAWWQSAGVSVYTGGRHPLMISQRESEAVLAPVDHALPGNRGGFLFERLDRIHNGYRDGCFPSCPPASFVRGVRARPCVSVTPA